MSKPELLRIRMVASLAGVSFAFMPGEEYDVEKGMAIALCTIPADEPRAVPVGWELTGRRGNKTREVALAPQVLTQVDPATLDGIEVIVPAEIVVDPAVDELLVPKAESEYQPRVWGDDPQGREAEPADVEPPEEDDVVPEPEPVLEEPKLVKPATKKRTTKKP